MKGPCRLSRPAPWSADEERRQLVLRPLVILRYVLPAGHAIADVLSSPAGSLRIPIYGRENCRRQVTCPSLHSQPRAPLGLN